MASDLASMDRIDITAPPPEPQSVLIESGILGPFQQKVAIESNLFPPPEQQMPAYETIVSNGPSSNRVDIVILGDGYTESEIDTAYPIHINGMLEYMFNAGQDPYPRYANFFNAHRINTISNESGADQPPNQIYRDTAFDAQYYCNAIERLLCINTTKVNAARNTALAGSGFNAEIQLVSVNDSKYGGSGGSYAVFAGGNSSANEVALHELGHSFNRLADEYGGSPTYTGPEPIEINVTIDPDGQKWQRWIGYNQNVIGTIGAYAGGRYFNQGIYRPSFNSKMRSLGRPFDAVGREKIILDIYNLVDPIDAWLDNSQPIEDSNPVLWVDPIDLAVQQIQWSVDGVPVAGANSTTFSLLDAGYGSGSYAVSARVYDPTDWVRHQLDKLEQTISWSVEIPPGPSVVAVGINGGDPSRSNVTSIQVAFDDFVNVTPSAFLLTNRSTGQQVPLQVSTSSAATGTIAALTFLAGASVYERVEPSLHSLRDGNYRLTVIASGITSTINHQTMDDDYSFGDQPGDAFFRLFGDRDGDRDVDGQDYGLFGLTFLRSVSDGNFDHHFDLDGDNDVDGLDWANFRSGLGKVVPWS